MNGQQAKKIRRFAWKEAARAANGAEPDEVQMRKYYRYLKKQLRRGGN